MLGKIFAHTKRESQETDIVLTLTPRIVRVLDLSENDLRAFKVQREGEGGGPVELPIPATLPPAAPRRRQPRRPARVRRAGRPASAPILPPAPAPAPAPPPR